MSQKTQFVVIVIGVTVAVAFVLGLLVGLAGIRGSMTVPIVAVSLSLGVVAAGIYRGVAGNKSVAIAGNAAKQAALGEAPADAARLLVLREGFVGKASGIDVAIDGVTATQLKAPRFAALTLAPGHHVIEAQAVSRPVATMPLDVAAGEVVAIRIVMTLSKVELVRETDLAAIRATLAGIPMVAA